MTTRIDPRGPRFAAGLTSVVLAAVLLTAPGPLATWLLAAQAAVFAVGAGLGVQRTPYAALFRALVRWSLRSERSERLEGPRLAPPTDWEDPGPPRFAQGVGLGFALVGLFGLTTGATTLGLVATGLALVAALLNAALGLCLGCELYLLLKRATARTARTIATNN